MGNISDKEFLARIYKEYLKHKNNKNNSVKKWTKDLTPNQKRYKMTNKVKDVNTISLEKCKLKQQ